MALLLCGERPETPRMYTKFPSVWAEHFSQTKHTAYSGCVQEAHVDWSYSVSTHAASSVSVGAFEPVRIFYSLWSDVTDAPRGSLSVIFLPPSPCACCVSVLVRRLCSALLRDLRALDPGGDRGFHL